MICDHVQMEEEMSRRAQLPPHTLLDQRHALPALALRAPLEIDQSAGVMQVGEPVAVEVAVTVPGLRHRGLGRLEFLRCFCNSGRPNS